MMSSCSDNLYISNELLFEILTWSSLTTVDKCKAVSKEVKDLIDDSWFLQNYCRKTNNVFGYFLQTFKDHRYVSTFVSVDPSKNPNISLESLNDDLRILASSNLGLLCCRRYDRDVRSYLYYVCKPCTRQTVLLPSPTKKLGQHIEQVALIVLKSNPLHYKVIRFSPDRHSPPECNSYACEIFDSKIWAWRTVDNFVTEFCTIFGNQQSICIGDVAYWLSNKDTILAFDSATETHSEFQLPKTITQIDVGGGSGGYIIGKQIVEYKGKLGLTCRCIFRSPSSCNLLLLWVLEDRKRWEWGLERVVRIDEKERKLMGCGLADVALMVGYETQVYEQGGFFYYSPPLHVFPFRSDFEPVNLEDGCMLSCLDDIIQF